MTTTTKTRESEIAALKSLYQDGMIEIDEYKDAYARIIAKYDVAGGTQPPTTATTAAKAAAPPAQRKSYLEAMKEEETEETEEKKPEPVTPWDIMELPAPLTKQGRIDRSNLNEINLRPVEAGEKRDTKDPKTGEKVKKWVGDGVPSGMIALDTGSQWKALYFTPKQLDQFITACSAVDANGENIMRTKLAEILATSQPQKIEIL